MRLCRPPPHRATSASEKSRAESQESGARHDSVMLLRWLLTLDSSLLTLMSLPGVEPGLRPSQSRVLPPHSKDKNQKALPRSAFFLAIARRPPLLPHRGIEPRPTASKAVMRPPHPQGKQAISRPGTEPGPGPSESPMQSATSKDVRRPIVRKKDIRGSLCLQSRRLDSHQHASAYKTDAFLSRATSAVSTSVRIRTPSSGFGGHPLSQEHARVWVKCRVRSVKCRRRRRVITLSGT